MQFLNGLVEYPPMQILSLRHAISWLKHGDRDALPIGRDATTDLQRTIGLPVKEAEIADTDLVVGWRLLLMAALNGKIVLHGQPILNVVDLNNATGDSMVALDLGAPEAIAVEKLRAATHQGLDDWGRLIGTAGGTEFAFENIYVRTDELVSVFPAPVEFPQVEAQAPSRDLLTGDGPLPCEEDQVKALCGNHILAETRRKGGSTSKRKGRPEGSTEYDWQAFSSHLMKLLDDTGGPSIDDAKWRNQAAFVKAMGDWCGANWIEIPGDSSLKREVSKGIEEYKSRKVKK